MVTDSLKVLDSVAGYMENGHFPGSYTLSVKARPMRFT